MLSMNLRHCENTSMSDVRKLINLFNSYTSEPSTGTTAHMLTPPPSKLKLTRRRSAGASTVGGSIRLSDTCDTSRNSSDGDWTNNTSLPNPDIEPISPELPSPNEPELQYNFRATSPRSTIDRTSTVRASLIKSIVATRAQEMARPQTAYASPNGGRLFPCYDQFSDPNEVSPISSPWTNPVEIETPPPEFEDELPPKPRWMESVERLSSVQPAVRQNWNVVNGQLRSKLRAADRLPHTK